MEPLTQEPPPEPTPPSLPPSPPPVPETTSPAAARRSAQTGLLIPDACFDTFQDLKLRKKHGYIIFTFDTDDMTLKVEKLGPKNASLNDFLAELRPTVCNFCVYDHIANKTDGYGSRAAAKVFLFSWMPTAAHTSLKMLFASERHKVVSVFTGVEVQNVVKRDDVMRAVGAKAKTDTAAADSDDEVADGGDDWMDN